MESQYLLLFRGINVGGHNIIPMKDLREALGSAGYKNVRSYIQSGNVLVESPECSQAEIRAIVRREFDCDPEILVITGDEFVKIAEENPYSDFQGNRVYVYFILPHSSTGTRDTSTIQEDAILEKMKAYAQIDEEIQLRERALYLHAPNGIGRSKLASKIERLLGVLTTARNLNTVNKLHDMLSS